jgi:hypothetical protein
MLQRPALKFFISIIILAFAFETANSQPLRKQSDPLQFSGIIRDEFNVPLPYSHIIITNAAKGSIADNRGRFSFIVYPNDTLVFSSLGYKRKEIVIPDDLDQVHYSIDIQLERDTFLIREVTVFPWATYEEFSEAFIALNLPEDDYDRAIANIALIQTWMEIEGLQADPAASFRLAMQHHHNRSMYAGQPPNNLLNPFSWAQFIQAIREGRFQRR